MKPQGEPIPLHLRPVDKFVFDTIYTINTKGEKEATYLMLLSSPESRWTLRTLQNAICRLKRHGLVEGYQSGSGFFTVKGSDIPRVRKVKLDGMGVPLLLASLSDGDEHVHDVHLTFSAPGLYEKLLGCGWQAGKRNLDIQLKPLGFDKGRTAKMRVHRTDTVSVFIASSVTPYKASSMVDLLLTLDALRDALEHEYVNEPVRLPPIGTWTVAAWHHGVDGRIAFEGPGFATTFEVWSNVLARLYAKGKDDGSRRPRLEVIDSPKSPLREAIRQLAQGLNSPDWPSGVTRKT